MMRRWIGILAFLVWGGASQAQTPSDPRLDPVLSYVRLMKGERLTLDHFLIHDAKRDVEEKLGKVPLPMAFAIRFLSQVPPERAAKFKRSKAWMIEDLKKAGYDTREIPKIGEGSAVAAVGPRVALVLAMIEVQQTKDLPKRQKGAYFILWLHQGRWKIATVDDFPARWMTDNRPPAEEKKP